jgi:hypothetical protein
VMDATGGGAGARLASPQDPGCGIVPVNLTGGERELYGRGVWWRRQERSIGNWRAWEVTVSRSGHSSFGTRREGEHDDLVMAAAPACWRARWRTDGIWGTKSLGL